MPRVGPYLWVGLHLWRLSSLWVPTWAASYSLSRRLRQAYIAFSVCAVATQGKKWMVSDLAIWLFHPLRSLHPLWTLWGQPLPHRHRSRCPVCFSWRVFFGWPMFVMRPIALVFPSLCHRVGWCLCVGAAHRLHQCGFAATVVIVFILSVETRHGFG